MNFRTLVVLVAWLSVAGVVASKPITVDFTDKTFPQALDALKAAVGPDSPFKKMTYSFPRIYHAKGMKGSGVCKDVPEEIAFQIIMEHYCRYQRLLGARDEKNHLKIVRDNAFHSTPLTLLEALALVQKDSRALGIQKEWEIVSAELKFESSSDYAGNYWHIKYRRSPGTDGGVNTHHFFVYQDLLVEHVRDGAGDALPRESTAAIIERMSMRSY